MNSDLCLCSYTDSEDKQEYEVRLCFKVLVNPRCYTVSPQTLLSPDTNQPIDELFDNTKLEWSTEQDREVYIYGLMVKIELPNRC